MPKACGYEEEELSGNVGSLSTQRILVTAITVTFLRNYLAMLILGLQIKKDVEDLRAQQRILLTTCTLVKKNHALTAVMTQMTKTSHKVRCKS